MSAKSAFFLGANTPQGFVSFFDELYNPYKACEVYIIKGGPGSGKSTLMKKIAAAFSEKGFEVRQFYCSSDPDSLDGLSIPERRLFFCDGTAPHTLEPRFPGAVENIINTGEFWDKAKLRKNADEIRRLYLENSIYHRRSAAYLAAAGRVDSQSRRLASSCIRREKLDSFSSRFIYRELPSKRKNDIGEKGKCFLSAITPKGNIFLADTVRSLCSRVIGIEDREGVASSLITERIGEGAIKNGYNVIYCHCPMNPSECEHIIIPEKRIAVVRIDGASGELECDRRIHTSRFMHDSFRENRSMLRLNSRIKAELIKESVSCLKKAKATHDKLEKIYIDAMDFDRLNEFQENFTESLFTS